MSISCTYPDRDSDTEAMNSGIFAEKLARFDLSHQYTLAVEEEVCLFFAKIFNLDLLENPPQPSDDKGKLLEKETNTLMYYWDDIPILCFTLIPEDYNGYTIRCSRLYEIDEYNQN